MSKQNTVLNNIGTYHCVRLLLLNREAREKFPLLPVLAPVRDFIGKFATLLTNSRL